MCGHWYQSVLRGQLCGYKRVGESVYKECGQVRDRPWVSGAKITVTNGGYVNLMMDIR